MNLHSYNAKGREVITRLDDKHIKIEQVWSLKILKPNKCFTSISNMRK